jgi:hypothetical protein
MIITQSQISARLKFCIFVNTQSAIQSENGWTLHIAVYAF